MRRFKAAVLVAATALFSASCSDRARDTLPTAPRSPDRLRPSLTLVPGECITLADLQAEAKAVFGAKNPNYNSVRGKIDNMAKHVAAGRIAEAQDHAFKTVDFILKNFRDGKLPATPEAVASLINHIFCYAGLAIVITDPANTNLIEPSNSTQTIKSKDNNAGTELPPGSITETTVLEFIPITDILFVNGKGPLNTKLDQYSGFFAIQAGTASGGGPATPVIVGICPAPGTSPSVRNRLRLGHQKFAGFEIAPDADATFLQCPTSIAQLDRLPKWMRSLANLVLPKPLFARMAQPEEFSGGVGGTAREFSDFAPIDPELRFAGGVGGTAGEFKKTPVPSKLGPRAPVRSSPLAPSTLLRPGALGSRLTTVVDGVCTAVEAPWGTPLEPECRPGVVIRTHLGTVMENVPIAWAVTLGGGTIAAETSGSLACGLFGSLASTTTDANGRAGVCWTLGSALGTNTVSATPSVGGDAPAGVTFVPASANFTATAIKRTPVATATGETVTYDGLNHPGSGTCTDGLTPALSYSGGSVPLNVGVYTLTVTCGDDNVRYNTVTATATIEIRFVARGLLGSSSGGGGLDLEAEPNPGRLFTVSTATGVATLVGVAPTLVLSHAAVAELSGVEVDPTTGTLYGIAGSACSGAKLITIDRNTGAETFVGSFVGSGFTGTSGTRCVGGSDALAIASDGTMYAGGWNGGTNFGSLLRIDKSTGAVLARFSTTVEGGRSIHLTGLAFDASGTLWASRGGNAPGRINTINPADGQTLSTLILKVSVGGATDFARVSDLALGPGGIMYASLPAENTLATIDLVTGVLTRIGSLGGAVNKMSGLTFGN